MECVNNLRVVIETNIRFVTDLWNILNRMDYWCCWRNPSRRGKVPIPWLCFLSNSVKGVPELRVYTISEYSFVQTEVSISSRTLYLRVGSIADR